MKISKGMIIFICVLNVLLTISFSLRFSKPDSTAASITLDSKNKNKVKDSPPQNKNADDNTNPSEGENTNSGFEKM